ncbi:unnamed protein product [Rhizoctonia solani]|uniref:Secreted protein n=1 Tax=Rhizoctonia solani TaxID=456999 RepID=A0A8H3A7Y6_9AGAM|nr:unnamed protein product [Rhizoctonia solani]
MLHHSISRLYALALVVLAFSMTVWAAPVGAGQILAPRGGTCLIGCTCGIETLEILTGLRNDLKLKLKTLDDCYMDNTDPTIVMNDITALFDTAGSRIKDLPVDLTGLLNGKAVDIVNMWISILTDLLEHFGKWNQKSNLNSRAISDIFAGLSGQLGSAIRTVQGALSGVFSSLSALLSNIIDSSRPHLEQLQEQLVGLGLNVLGSIFESIQNVRGSITSG